MSIETRKALGFKHDAIQHLDALWRTATWITSSESEAEKLTENVYKEAYLNWGISSASPDIRIPLFKILIKACPIDHDWDKIASLSGITEYSYSPAYNEALSQIAVIPPNFITGAIRSLPVENRIIMVLSSIEKFSYSEIAQITGSSIAAVSKMKCLSCNMINRRLSEYNESTFDDVVSN